MPDCPLVRSWEGERNSIDSSKVEDEGKRRKGRDDWDWELDRGKVLSVCLSVCLCLIVSNFSPRQGSHTRVWAVVGMVKIHSRSTISTNTIMWVSHDMNWPIEWLPRRGVKGQIFILKIGIKRFFDRSCMCTRKFLHLDALSSSLPFLPPYPPPPSLYLLELPWQQTPSAAELTLPSTPSQAPPLRAHPHIAYVPCPHQTIHYFSTSVPVFQLLVYDGTWVILHFCMIINIYSCSPPCSSLVHTQELFHTQAIWYCCGDNVLLLGSLMVISL